MKPWFSGYELSASIQSIPEDEKISWIISNADDRFACVLRR
jgi:hypothetical protein